MTREMSGANLLMADVELVSCSVDAAPCGPCTVAEEILDLGDIGGS